MDKFIVEADELDDETSDEHHDCRPVVRRHKSAHMATFLFWCATLISFIDRYSLSGVLSEGNVIVIVSIVTFTHSKNHANSQTLLQSGQYRGCRPANSLCYFLHYLCAAYWLFWRQIQSQVDPHHGHSTSNDSHFGGQFRRRQFQPAPPHPHRTWHCRVYSECCLLPVCLRSVSGLVAINGNPGSYSV